MSAHPNALLRSRLATALLFVLATPAAFAQDATPTSTTSADSKSKELDKVVVTGSLIPQTEKETFKPVITITAEDLKNRGFTSVSDALQANSVATGGVQGNQTSASFTQGAETISLFGLPPGYVKYLIDGRPMANYPALYNGTDVFNNISGIPVDLVERIEILPGGQSSLYGSDAIAGVINVILRKKTDGAILSARVGGYEHGGGDSRRFSFADTFNSEDGRFNLLFGLQNEKTDPIYASQRELTRQFNTNGHAFGVNADTGIRDVVTTSPALASRDWVVLGAGGNYYFPDGASCTNLTGLFEGTVDLRNRANRGEYCGSFYTPGYRTLKNSKDSTQVYTHGTFDLSENTQLYADVLLNRETVRYNSGSNYLWWGTGVKWGYYYDPALDDFVNLQRAFAPEEVGDWNRTESKDRSSSYAVTVGVNGVMGNWDYDIGFTRTNYRLTSQGLIRLDGPINDFFQNRVLGPQLGTDPYDFGYPAFSPDYAAFFSPITPAEFASFTDYSKTRSSTSDNLFRAQFTNAALFSLPGGDAGIAIAAEAGNETWQYNPDARFLNGEVWGTTDVTGNGSRSRAALTGELRLPLLSSLTLSASARYDRFKIEDHNLSKPTYSLGIEYRPIQSLLFRGKYGTAFRAPTLADLFQGVSGYYNFATDYYRCSLDGFDPSEVRDCDYNSVQYFGQTSGNTELQPITAKVWSYGVVWAPTARFSMGADYHHWSIRNEVTQQDVDQLLRDELACRTGDLPATSGTCEAALSQIVRGSNNAIQSIFTKKVNVSSRVLDVVTFDLNYQQPLGDFGTVTLAGNWTRNLKHDYRLYPNNPEIDLINNPYWSTDPAYKATASAGWARGNWGATLYANYIGPTPNYLATLDEDLGYDYSPYAKKLGSYTTLNGSVNYQVTPALRLSLMVNNIADRMPDMDWTYPGTSSAPYNTYNFNALGRGYYLEARYNFGKK